MVRNLPILSDYFSNQKHVALTGDDDFDNNIGLCILSPQAAFIIKNHRKKPKHQYTTQMINYAGSFALYSKSIEGMILLALEIKALTVLVESFSFYLAESFTDLINNTRRMLFSGDIKLSDPLPTLIENVNKMSFLFLFCKRLHRTASWIAFEPLRQKADLLFEMLDTPALLENIDRNLNVTNDIVNHVDNLYSADLSESSNDLAYLGILLASTPLLLSIISLPSFWVDIRQLFFTFLPQLPQSLANDITTALNLFALIGTVAVIVVTVFSLYLLFAIRRRLSASIRMFLRSYHI